MYTYLGEVKLRVLGSLKEIKIIILRESNFLTFFYNILLLITVKNKQTNKQTNKTKTKQNKTPNEIKLKELSARIIDRCP